MPSDVRFGPLSGRPEGEGGGGERSWKSKARPSSPSHHHLMRSPSHQASFNSPHECHYLSAARDHARTHTYAAAAAFLYAPHYCKEKHSIRAKNNRVARCYCYCWVANPLGGVRLQACDTHSLPPSWWSTSPLTCHLPNSAIPTRAIHNNPSVCLSANENTYPQKGYHSTRARKSR